MTTLIMILILTLVTVAVCEIGNRTNLPWPALMVLVGVGIAWVPGSHLNVPADLVLPLFLPPLLYSAAERTSWQMFRHRWRSIVIFAIGMTVVTIGIVAGASWVIYPGIGLPAAMVLGAMVAPPDPVAVEAVSKTVPMPRRILSTLQTEGLFNDAVALVVFEVALVALTTDEGVSARLLLSDFLVGMVLALVVGIAVATIIRFIVRLSDSAVASAAATVVLPYAAYLLSEEIHASGVLAVVVAALEYRRTESPDDVEERLVRTSFWEVIELVITGIAFGLIGEGFQNVIEEYGADVWPMIWDGLIVAAVVVVVRFGYLAILNRFNRSRKTLLAPRSRREVLIMTWGGMRGLITLSLAVSLPTFIGPDDTYFAYRAPIVVACCMVLVVTLLLAGLTMPFVMNKVEIGTETEIERKQEAELAKRAGKRAFTVVKDMPDLPEPISERLDSIVEHIQSEMLEKRVPDELDQGIMERRIHRESLTRVNAAALAAAREAVMEARNEPGVDPVIVDRLLQRLDMQTSLTRKRF